MKGVRPRKSPSKPGGENGGLPPFIPCYSYLNASVGISAAARRAGPYPKTTPTTVLNWTTEVSTIAVVGYGKTVAGVETGLIPEARPGPDLAKR